ncbi:hypothetical protein VTK56DRAFT_8425 [Thermocarpiscus australiensis]
MRHFAAIAGLPWSSLKMPLLRHLYGTVVSETLPPAAANVPDGDRSQRMVYVLTILSLAFASVSVLSTLPTLYWFVKMRRSFRHELILLLIQSDFLESMAFVIFPIVSLILGNVQSDSAFCQLSGFALAVGIQSSDIAVLLIALHSAMYIFRPRSGLYPYRQLAYSLFYLFPVTTASLAFINGNGYENVGHYCYLRTDTRWGRLSLSWIPRYVICATIAIVYAYIYVYIRKRMGGYRRRHTEAMHQPELPKGSRNVPPTPRICCHGLIPSTPTSRRTSETDYAAKDRQAPSSSINPSKSRNGKTATAGPMSPIQWNWTGFARGQSSEDSRRSVDTPVDPLSPKPVPISSPPAAHTHQPHPSALPGNRPELSAVTSQSPFDQRPLPASQPIQRGSIELLDQADCKRSLSLPSINIMHMCRKASGTCSADTHHVTVHSLALLSPVADDGAVFQQREKIRRQSAACSCTPWLT